MKEIKIEIIVEIPKLVGCSFNVDDKLTMWEDMTRQQQIYVLNALTQGLSLFRRFLKDE